VPLAFLTAVAIGTLLLCLPIARAGDGSAPFITALFTAMSAVCVTGLVLVDTATYWSGFGEVVLLVMMQIGGFGIMTLASLLGLVVAGRLRLSDRLATQAETKVLGLGDVRRVLTRVAMIAICVELVLAIILGLRFHYGYGFDVGKSIWHGIFHAVAAFNSAGFALYHDSLERFVTDPVITVPIMIASIIGGIGFPVVVELVRRTFRPSQWSIHTKITVFGTFVLLFVGFVAYVLIEWNNAKTLGGLSAPHKVQAAFFASAMPRSAGFNSIPIGDLRPETWAFTDILMFIGGGSAGTAGGIKVATFFLLAFVIWAEVRGEPDVSVFGRRIPTGTQRQALTVALLGVGAVAVGTISVLAVTDLPLDKVLFDVTSAFGTVGLSSGVTADLNTGGQLIMVLLMFTGRVGTVTVATALALRSRTRRFHYPEERPIVG
jgi:trk system potassium uptake protein TrkH